MLKKAKETIEKVEKTANDIEEHKFEILAGVTAVTVFGIICYLAGFKDGSRHFFIL